MPAFAAQGQVRARWGEFVVDLPTIISMAAAIANVGTLGTVVWQLRSLGHQSAQAAHQNVLTAETMRGMARLNIMQEMIRLDQFFCDRPELREAIYGPPNGKENGPGSQRVDAAAEMIVDFAECLMFQAEHFDGEPLDAWVEYFQSITRKSEAVRQFWAANRHWYEEGMAILFDTETSPAPSAP
jgi:hypothetical protein